MGNDIETSEILRSALIYIASNNSAAKIITIFVKWKKYPYIKYRSNLLEKQLS